jgi:hypothetical protein
MCDSRLNREHCFRRLDFVREEDIGFLRRDVDRHARGREGAQALVGDREAPRPRIEEGGEKGLRRGIGAPQQLQLDEALQDPRALLARTTIAARSPGRS